MLNVIDNFLTENPNRKGHQLWLILTALRGDDREQADKFTSTGCIRSKALPAFSKSDQMFDYRNATTCSSAPIFADPANFEGKNLGEHFWEHTMEAARILGLVE